MARPITKGQFADLWLAEFVSPNGHCGLCGNKGLIDTRGKMFTLAGVECGVKAYCICPNGRSLKRAMTPRKSLPEEPGKQSPGLARQEPGKTSDT